MVTDPPTDAERAASPPAYGMRLLVTALLVALYLAGHLVPLPGIRLDLPAYGSLASRLTLLVLGLAPLVTGFLLVELFALVTTPGRRLRAAGSAGRGRLNRAALATSLVMSAVQALGIALFLENTPGPGIGPLVNEPGWPFRLLLVATLTAVTAAVFALGNLLSDHGIGNGFALLMLAELGASSWGTWMAVRGELTADNWPLSLALFAGVGLVALLVRFVRSTEKTGTPPFPQGILPVQLTLVALAFLWFRSGFGPLYQGAPFAITPLVVALLGTPLFSWLTFHLFSSRPRLAANLPEPDEVLDGIAAILRRRLIPSTAVLAVGTLAFLAWNAWRPGSATAHVTFTGLVFATMIGLDILDQFQFLQRHGQTVRLVQLDNVHLSYRLAARLREEGIDALARAQRLRSLSYFFGALFKIDVLVPAGQYDRAREVLVELESAPQVKVF